MADEGMTITGLAQFRAAVSALPETVRARSRAVAQSVASRILAGARARLIAQQKTAQRELADAIEIAEDPANQAVLVISKPPAGQPANLPLWNEHGTVKMPGRHYMHDATVAEAAAYRSEMLQVVEETVRQALE